jgi:hypothetical protein
MHAAGWARLHVARQSGFGIGVHVTVEFKIKSDKLKTCKSTLCSFLIYRLSFLILFISPETAVNSFIS